MGQTKTISSGGGNRKCNQEQNKNQPLDARTEKIKDKVSYLLFCYLKKLVYGKVNSYEEVSDKLSYIIDEDKSINFFIILLSVNWED